MRTAGQADGSHLDLNFNYPSLPGQAELLRAALRQLALSADMEALLRYQPHAGRRHERASVARHLQCRGLAVGEDRVLIVSGGSPPPPWRCCAPAMWWRPTP